MAFAHRRAPQQTGSGAPGLQARSKGKTETGLGAINGSPYSAGGWPGGCQRTQVRGTEPNLPRLSVACGKAWARVTQMTHMGPHDRQGRLCGLLCVWGSWAQLPLLPWSHALCPPHPKPAGEQAGRPPSPGPARLAGYLLGTGWNACRTHARLIVFK